MDRKIWNNVLSGLILFYSLGSMAAMLLWSPNWPISQDLTTALLISSLVCLIVLYVYNHYVIRKERQNWLKQTRHLEEEVGIRSEQLQEKNAQLKTFMEDIHHLGYYDALTDLPNRRLFMRHLTKALESARYQGRMFAVLFVDLDNFKVLNDNLGHNLGDLVLKKVGEKISTTIRPMDIVSRHGGDEFMVLLNEIATIDEAKQMIDSIHKSIREPFLLGTDMEIFVEVSIGVAIYPRHGDNIENLIKYADIAMYEAKNQGKNQSIVYTVEMHKYYARRMTLDNELRSALKNDEFSLYYQPQVSIKTGEIVGVEALVRWHNHILGAVNPSELIPIVEENGQIIQLGEWVISTACRQLKAWHDEGYHIPKIAVNVSPVQFNSEKLVSCVQRVLRDTGLAAPYLELEITEGVAIFNQRSVSNKLMALKRLGIQLALDDFGTGYSCLAYLSQYPVDTLKIDQRFIRNLQDRDNRMLVDTMITMAHNFDLKVVAEGVSTIEQYNYIRDKGCDEMQGYLISEPLNSNNLIRLVEMYSQKTTYIQSIS
ncbi:MAG: bifunctional diguanylate cyclase/phosphodiesterase [Syntrophomonadaceae bacterium]|nr:bifunctional diguanylate cyclase/phosphodiesterase [Syntrophomonadaceae bacterium]